MTKSKYYLITLLTAILLSVVLGSSSAFASGYIFYQPSGTDYQRTLNAVERAQEQQTKALSSIEASNIPLTEAQSLMKQREELNEAHNTITKLENELNKAKT